MEILHKLMKHCDLILINAGNVPEIFVHIYHQNNNLLCKQTNSWIDLLAII